MSKSGYFLYCDGACRGNPGPAAIGAVILDSNGSEILTISKQIGHATNNESEYQSLIEGIGAFLSLNLRDYELSILMDSQLVVRQIQGKYKVKNERLKPLFTEVQKRLSQLTQWKIQHIAREINKRADELANNAYI